MAGNFLFLFFCESSQTRAKKQKTTNDKNEGSLRNLKQNTHDKN